MQVLAVWEPVIFTDIGLPGNAALALLPDRRVTQTWDPNRLLSDSLYPMLMTMYREERESGVGEREEEDVPAEGEVVWDFLGFYPPGARWDDSPPRPAYAGFPVIETMDRLKELLSQRLTPAADAPSTQPPSPAAAPSP